MTVFVSCQSGGHGYGMKCIQRNGSPIRKLESMNGVAPYRPLARSLMNVALSSRNAGTYATAMKLMNADPKNWKVSQA